MWFLSTPLGQIQSRMSCEARAFISDAKLASRIGDVKKLKPPFTGFRLRCGDYRVFFDLKDDNTIEITAVRHRKDAYR